MEDDSSDRGHYLAGELAAASGVSTDTLRHYERKGVLKRPPRGSNGYRLYAKGELERVLLIRRALSFGFTLDELARVLNERDLGGTPCGEVRRLVGEKLSDVEEQLVSLEQLRDDLKATIHDWDKRLKRAKSGDKVRLLENMPSARVTRKKKLTPNKKVRK